MRKFFLFFINVHAGGTIKGIRETDLVGQRKTVSLVSCLPAGEERDLLRPKTKPWLSGYILNLTGGQNVVFIGAQFLVFVEVEQGEKLF